MLLNSHILAYARCLAGKVCGLVRSTWGTFLREDTLGARHRILNTKVACQACAGQTFPQYLMAVTGKRAQPLHPRPRMCSGALTGARRPYYASKWHLRAQMHAPWLKYGRPRLPPAPRDLPFPSPFCDACRRVQERGVDFWDVCRNVAHGKRPGSCTGPIFHLF